MTNPLPTTGKQWKKPVDTFHGRHFRQSKEPSEYSLFTVNNCEHGKGTDSNLFTVNVLINKQPVGMQIDTGAVVSIMSENNFGPR